MSKTNNILYVKSKLQIKTKIKQPSFYQTNEFIKLPIKYCAVKPLLQLHRKYIHTYKVELVPV